MRLHRIVITFSALVAIAGSPVSNPDNPILGFTADQTIAQRELESKFDSFLNADNLRNWMKQLTAHPHHVGSPWGKENAEFIAGQFKSWGYDTKIETFHVLFPTPKIRSLEMIEPTFFKAELAEPELKEDATSGQKDEQLPSYNAYSVDGD
ncbi:MAG: folate hydrolase, partial [bacterium]